MQDILQIKKENAIKAYEEATPKEKATLERLFEKKNLVRNITEQVKTFADALEMYDLDEDENELLAYSGKNKKMKSAKAHLKAQIWTEALNNGWTPDWDNSNQKKWYPWFRMTPGFAFDASICAWTGTASHGGSRLVFETEELARFAGTNEEFFLIYKDILY